MASSFFRNSPFGMFESQPSNCELIGSFAAIHSLLNESFFEGFNLDVLSVYEMKRENVERLLVEKIQAPMLTHQPEVDQDNLDSTIFRSPDYPWDKCRADTLEALTEALDLIEAISVTAIFELQGCRDTIVQLSYLSEKIGSLAVFAPNSKALIRAHHQAVS